MSQIANEIRSQLGNQALSMLGAYNFSTNGSDLQFNIKGSRRANVINIKYDEAYDLYNVEFAKFRKFEYKVVKEVNLVYADSLLEIIEEETGLFTKLF